jgi:hypothetical protein
VRNDAEWHDVCMKNSETNEKLVIKKVNTTAKVRLRKHQLGQKMALISRYPSNSYKEWIEANEREVVEWNFGDQNSRIYIHNPIKNAM